MAIHVKLRDAEEFDVPAADVLPILAHGALAVVGRRELDVGLSRGLLALVEDEVHAVERH